MELKKGIVIIIELRQPSNFPFISGEIIHISAVSILLRPDEHTKMNVIRKDDIKGIGEPTINVLWSRIKNIYSKDWDK